MGGSDISMDPTRAQRVLSAFDKQRLQQARTLRGLSQGELAAAAGPLTAAAISQWENGHTRPSVESLQRIAEALQVPLEFFERADARSADLHAFFRSKRSTTSAARGLARARVEVLHDLVRGIEAQGQVDLPTYSLSAVRLPPPLTSTSTRAEQHEYYARIEELARDVRAMLRLGPGPISDVIRTIERAGVVVVRMSGVDEKIDAFSVPYAERPVIVLASDKGDACRSRMDACHEVAHLVAHPHAVEGDKTCESEANALGGALLLPRATLEPELRESELTVARLVELKMRWGASIAALLYRAQLFGVIEQHRYLQWMKYSSSKGWRRPNGEPGNFRRPEEPVLLARALAGARDALGPDAVERIARNQGLPQDLVTSLLPTRRIVTI